MTSLSNNQKLFCQEYLKLGMNATQAYLKVYKTCKKEETAGVNASRLLKNARVQEYIAELQGKVEKKAVVNIQMIVDELATIAFTDRTNISKCVTEEIDVPEQERKLRVKSVVFSDTDKLTKEEKKVIAGYKQTQSGFAVETYDKMKALELLGKYLGMFKEESPTINNNIINPYANLSEEELRKLANG